MAEAQMVHQVTLSTDKVVLLKELEIRHQRLAGKAAAQRSGNDANLLGMNMAEEVLKLLIAKVGDQIPKGPELEDLDKLFTYREYTELMKVIAQLMGTDVPDPKTEVVSFGGQ